MIPRNKNVFCLHCSMHRHRSLSPWNRDDCESLLCFKEASCSQLFNGWQTSGKKKRVLMSITKSLTMTKLWRFAEWYLLCPVLQKRLRYIHIYIIINYIYIILGYNMECVNNSSCWTAISGLPIPGNVSGSLDFATWSTIQSAALLVEQRSSILRPLNEDNFLSLAEGRESNSKLDPASVHMVLPGTMTGKHKDLQSGIDAIDSQVQPGRLLKD